MKINLLTYGILAASIMSICSCVHENACSNRAERLSEMLRDPECGYVFVACHRGDWRNYPENSIPAIESVIRQGADIMELDIQQTKDSVLVLCHDSRIDRTTNGKGRVRDITYDSLMTFRLKRAHGVTTDSLRMPTLRQALEVCKDRIIVNIDHGYTYYGKVMEIVGELGMENQVIIKNRLENEGMPEIVGHNLAQSKKKPMYMPIVSPDQHIPFDEFEKYGVTPVAYEACWKKTTPEVEHGLKQIADSPAKLWVNSLWSSLCGGLDDDAALEQGCDSIYGKLLGYNVKVIQTDRAELLIPYLEAKGLRDL